MLKFVTNQTARGTEWPLWNYDYKCPCKVYVGGVSRFLCRCDEPQKCPGVIAIAEQVEKDRF